MSSQVTKESLLEDFARMDRGETIETKRIKDEPGPEDFDDDGDVDEHGRPLTGGRERDDDLEDDDQERDEDLDDEDDKVSTGKADPDEDDEDLEDEKPREKTEEKPKKDEADDDLAKRSRKIQQLEKRHREQIARDRAELERDAKTAEERIRTQWGPRVAKAEEFESLLERGKANPVGVLMELAEKIGLTADDDREAVARNFFALTKAAADKPGYKEQAQRILRERELAAKSTTIEQQVADLQKQIKERDERDAKQREEAAYLDGLMREAKIAKATAPLVARQLAKNPDKAREAMQNVAYRLFKKNGTVPDAAKVVRVYEKQRRRDLEDAGVDIAALLGKGAGGEKPAVKAGKKPGEKPAAKSDKPKTREETLDELRAELEAMS